MKSFLFACMAFVVSLVSFAASPLPDEPTNASVLVIDTDHFTPVLLVEPFEFGMVPADSFADGYANPPVLIIGNGAGLRPVIESLSKYPGVILIDPGSGRKEDSAISKEAIESNFCQPIPLQCFADPFPDVPFIANDYSRYIPSRFDIEGYLNRIPTRYQSYDGKVYRGERAYIVKR